MALGGPNYYIGDNIRKVHQKVNNGAFPIEEHFGVIANHLHDIVGTWTI